MTMSSLVLGPMMRYVDETSASIWVETRTDSRVTVRAGGSSWEARTFAVHGHHYALVEADGTRAWFGAAVHPGDQRNAVLA